jgi:hypothetical protein
MPKTSQSGKFFESSTNRIGVILLVVLVFILGFFLIKSTYTKKAPSPITEDQIELQRGDDIVIVNKNGLVEYRSKDNVFYETWDSSRITSFFSVMEAKAKQKQAGDCKYKATMYINHKLVEFCIDSSDSDMKEVYNEYDQVIGNGSLGDFFPTVTSTGPGDGDLGSIEYFPSPTVMITAFPTPTPGGGGNQTNYPPVNAGCDTWSSLIVKNRAIISNTYCTVQPTPTP